MTAPVIDYAQLSDEELSAKVAEEMMGWHRITDKYRDRGWLDKDGRETGWLHDGFRAHWEEGDEPIWSPATSIADAWEVVEKLETGGWRVELTRWSDGWYVKFRRVVVAPTPSMPEGKRIYVEQTQTDTAPRAICLAALRAKGALDGE
jgi:hypothetical protein